VWHSTAERFELEEIMLSDLLDLTSQQLSMLIPRKAVRQVRGGRVGPAVAR
jgi:hypothetical protein